MRAIPLAKSLFQFFDIGRKEPKDMQEDPLMAPMRGGRHAQFPVDEFVRQHRLRKLAELLERQLDRRDGHTPLPG